MAIPALQFRYTAYTGPCIVGQVAAQLRELGLNVFLEGTQNVYISSEKTIPELTNILPSWIARELRQLP